jgi:hypothetical protein
MSLVSNLNEAITELQNNSNDLLQYKNRAIELDLVDNANTIKESIVNVGGNVGLTTECYTSDTSYLTSTYGSMVTGIGVTYGSSLGISGIGTELVAYGSIKYDILEAYNYPKIESINADTENPFIGEGYIGITESNSGIGAETRYLAGEGSIIGTVLSISTVSPCTGEAIANNITSLIVQYNNSISGISSYVSLASAVKKYKTEYQFHVWSYSRKIKENDEASIETTSLVDILSDSNYGGPY